MKRQRNWVTNFDNLQTCFIVFVAVLLNRGRRMIEISGSLIWSKTLVELIFNPCGEFRWSPEGPVSQIHSPHLRVGAPGFFSDLLGVCSDAKERVGCGNQGKLPHLFIPGKTAALVLEFALEDLPSADMQLWFSCLQWRTCPWPEHSDDDDDDDDDDIKSANRLPRKHCYQSLQIHCL